MNAAGLGSTGSSGAPPGLIRDFIRFFSQNPPDWNTMAPSFADIYIDESHRVESITPGDCLVDDVRFIVTALQNGEAWLPRSQRGIWPLEP